MRTIENQAEDAVLNGLNVFLGIALFLAPWYLELSNDSVAARNAFVCGVAIAIIAMLALSKPLTGRYTSISPSASGWPRRLGCSALRT